MKYKSLRQCVNDLEKHGQLVRVKEEIDPNLEIAEIQRRLYLSQGPAVLFENVKGSKFPALANLYGTVDRMHFIFRSTIKQVKKIVKLKADPSSFFKAPHKFLDTPFVAVNALPIKARFRKPILHATTTLDQLPQIKSWPMDGGPYVLLPQVYTEDPESPGVMKSNLGMYRVQIAGNDYIPNKEIGVHYQIHRGIGVHHTKAAAKGEKLKVSVFVGGPPAHSFGAVMPLPEGLTELMFYGLFAGRNFRYLRKNGHTLSSDADFVITGTIDPTRTKPEGPFGDHLGYYSLQHEFPVMEIEQVYHRKDAIWPFTVVGRPPQEDTSFGEMIHEVTKDMVPVSVPGLHAMHAVDAAGVHPLLLTIGSERYVPYKERYPQELLTVANAVLGFGQASLAKYLMILAKEDNPPSIDDIEAFFTFMLERIDWKRDLHFQTRTTMDTLDYSGTGLNQGSKVVMAAAGKAIRELGTDLPDGFSLPMGFSEPKWAMPGILAVSGPKFSDPEAGERQAKQLESSLGNIAGIDKVPMIVLCDDSDFTSRNLNNFLWTTFTRSNPSHDIYGVGSFTEHKHWGCTGPLIIDARIKPHHAPPLVENPEVSKRVDELMASGGPLHGIIKGDF
ncbi:MAG: UbiD family decarboxylase [Bacteroidia bacterium]|nr:UbiD family decarboxylase [Bacteroidia bacterium]